MNDQLLAQQRAYADLIIRVGVNLQPDQAVAIRAELGHREFVRLLTAVAYDAGASHVEVLWLDPLVNKIRYQPAGQQDSFPARAAGVSGLRAGVRGGSRP